MNVHNLNHLVDFIEKFGPWKGFSCFPFESIMGYFKNKIHVTKDWMKTYSLTSTLHEFIPQQHEKLIPQNAQIKV